MPVASGATNGQENEAKSENFEHFLMQKNQIKDLI